MNSVLERLESQFHSITHYYRSEPFRTLTSAPPNEWSEIISQMGESNTWGIGRFSHPEYLNQRIEVEKRLRDIFIKKGGQPALEHPIYFFLGCHPRFEEHPSNKAYPIALSDVPSDSVSFTYGDSMLALIPENRVLSGEKYQNPLCETVYRLEELPDLLAHPSFPTLGALSIEAQLWMMPNQFVCSG